jgi:hypothetical protein
MIWNARYKNMLHNRLFETWWNTFVNCIIVLMFILLLYTGCPRRNVPDFGRVFVMLKYTDITQNTYVQSWTVTEIMAREKCGLLFVPRTIPISWEAFLFDLDSGLGCSISAVFVTPALESPMLSPCVTYSAWNSKDSYDMVCEFFVVRFNGVTSLTS